MTIRSTDDEVSEIVATGSPAPSFSISAGALPPGLTLDTVSGVVVYARARNIQYDVKGEVLTLLEKATVTQEGSTVTGERIVYYIKEQRVKASAGSAASGQPRVETIIPPRRNSAPETAPETVTPPAASPDNGAS